MSKRSYYFGGMILLLAASFFFAKKLKRNDAPEINLSSIALTDLDGNPVNLRGFGARPMVVNFWGSWCGPCRQEFPGFEKARKKYGSQIDFVMISDEPGAAIVKFKNENPYTFFYVKSQQAFRELGITSVPVTYFYDAKGNLVAKIKEPLDEVTFNGLIGKMMNGR